MTNPPFMGNSSIPPYLKWMSAACLGLTYLGALAYAGWLLVWHPETPIPGPVYLVLGTGLSVCLGILNAHQSVSLAESNVTATGSTPGSGVSTSAGGASNGTPT